MGCVFLISGLGADSRLYKNIKLGITQAVLVEWLIPDFKDTLGAYAEKLISQYGMKDGDVVIGTSLGGMIAVEIANRLKLDKVILISSIKTIDEAPWYFPLFRALPIYKGLPDFALTRVGRLARVVFGKMPKQEANLFADMLRQSSPKFLRWAMYAVLYWENRTVPQNLYHIIGDKDLIFNYKRIIKPTILKGGTHIMIFDRANEVNEWLQKVLNS